MVLACAERVGWRRVFVFEGLLPRRMAAAAGPSFFYPMRRGGCAPRGSADSEEAAAAGLLRSGPALRYRRCVTCVGAERRPVWAGRF